MSVSNEENVFAHLRWLQIQMVVSHQLLIYLLTLTEYQRTISAVTLTKDYHL